MFMDYIKYNKIIASLLCLLEFIQCARSNPLSFHTTDKKLSGKKGETEKDSLEFLLKICLKTKQLDMRKYEKNEEAFYELEYLDLSNISIFPDTFMKINKFTKLKRLCLSNTTSLTMNDINNILSLKRLITLKLINCNLKGGSLKNISNLQSLAFLDISNNKKLSVEDYKSLSQLKNLKTLLIHYNKMMSVYVEYITNIITLEELSFYNSEGLTSKDLDMIFNKLDNLDGLALNDIKLEKEYDMANIQKIKSLNILDFSLCSTINIKNCESIFKLTNLVKLRFYECQLQENSLIGIENLVNLTYFNISLNKNLSFDDLRAICRLKYLNTLFLYDMNLKKNSLLDLHKLTRLEHLQIKNYSNISEYELLVISKITSLKKLSLIGCELEVNSILPLTSHSRLERLVLENNKLDESIFSYIFDFDELKYLNLKKNNINLGREVTDKQKMLKEFGIEAIL